jgi:uncharacterized membrane protein
MANGDEPELPDSADANDRRPQLTAIEERVDRLERELAALQRQIAGAAPPQAISAPPPPPRPSLPRSEPVATPAAPQRLTSEAWASARPRAASVPESRDSLESRLGSQVFNRVAIVLLLIGTALGMKLAVDRGLIGPTGRVILGLLAGAALVLWSERFRRKGFAAFSYSLKAVGSGVLYLSLWAAFRLYGLLPAEAALGLMILVTAWNAFMAWVQNSELLAMYALAGGFATPMLLSTGGNHEIFLFTYLLAIDAATVVLVRLRNWPRLLIGAFPLTVIYFIGWYAMYFAADALTVTATFVALFAAAFAAVSVGGTANDADAPVGGLSTVLGQILLPLGNAAFAALALYFVLENSGHHAWLPWLMLVLAAAYLGLMRLPQTAVASAIHLSLAVVFLTIAIPLKASGAWITASWLVEGLALLWVATRLGEDEAEAAYALRTLRGLGAASLALGFCGVCFHLLDATDSVNLPLWNNGTGTALTAVAVFAAAAWLSLGSGPASAGDATRAEAWARIAMGAFLLIAMTAALLTLREVGASWTGGWAHPAFATTDFAMAILALAIFAGLVAISLQLAKERLGEDFWMNCAALSTIAFNLVAVLTGVREVAAVWSPAPNAWSADAALQQALAISSFLMLYGAALLAVGFWRRSGFLRWQALVLLVFTIFKTFLYDMRDLSQGYRVVSFLGLGALLLAISFAYQKDWLNLRKSEPAPGADSGASK